MLCDHEEFFGSRIGALSPSPFAPDLAAEGYDAARRNARPSKNLLARGWVWRV